MSTRNAERVRKCRELKKQNTGMDRMEIWTYADNEHREMIKDTVDRLNRDFFNKNEMWL